MTGGPTNYLASICSVAIAADLCLGSPSSWTMGKREAAAIRATFAD